MALAELTEPSGGQAGGTAPPEPFGVYVHWPFCLSKCPYCDFNSHVRHAAIDETRYLRAFAAELAAGPTIAHAATKAVVRAQADHGTHGADALTAELTSHLFETEDCRNAVQSFLREGPGKATFTGNFSQSK